MNRIKRLVCRLRRGRGQRMTILEKYEVLLWQRGMFVIESVQGKALCERCGRVRLGMFHKVLGVGITLNPEEQS